jgi:hypothetical protein
MLKKSFFAAGLKHSARFVGLTLLASSPSYGADFSVVKGHTDNVGSYSYDSGVGTLQLSDPAARWVWYLSFSQPGTYTVSARVAVAAAHAGATLRIGDWISQHGGPASFAEAALTATDPSANVNPQWQVIGQVNIPQAGLRRIFARVPTNPTGDPGLLYDLRLEGPGLISEHAYSTIRANACDISFSRAGSDRGAFYAEMVSRPLPIPKIGGTHTVINTPGGYMGNNDGCFQSLWDQPEGVPAPLVAFGGSRVFTHEGSGSSIGLDDFYLDSTRRRKSINIAVPDGNGNTITTFLTGEVGQRWHLGGRTRQYAVKYAGNSGFLENFSVFNAHIHRRSCAWGNVWSYGDSDGDGSYEWWGNDDIKGHLRGPSPSTEPTETSVSPYGLVRPRQDMQEMIIGGMIPIAQNDTWYYNAPTTTPDLPTLNLAYNLPARETVNPAPDAQAGTVYSGDLTTLIHDPFSMLDFEFAKISGPAWLSVNTSGSFGGTPTGGDAGLNLAIVQATDPHAGLFGEFTVGVYVADTGNNAPAFLDHPALVQTIPTLDDAGLLNLSFVDPDAGDNHTISIIAGNGAGFFGINSNELVKVGTPVASQTYSLTLQVEDDGTGTLADALNVDVQVVAGDGMGGATEEVWYIAGGETLADLTGDPRYPDSPDRMGAVRDFQIDLLGRMTGYRVRGYLYPPATGFYQFYGTYDSALGEFRLSTDDTEGNLVLRSNGASVSLAVGQRYYFEMVCKNTSNYSEGSQTMEWTGPGILQQVIGAHYLSAVEYATPGFGNETLALRDVLVNENYEENLRPKLETLYLWDVLSYQKISGPAWLTVSADGVLTGTPGGGDSGSNVFVIRTTAPGGHYDEAIFTIDVQENSAPQFAGNPIALSNLDEYSEIEGSLASYATDVNVGSRLGFGDALSLSIVAGPDWLNIEPTGELYGSPGVDDQGLNEFTLRVTDLGGLTAETQVSLTVDNAAFPPVIQDAVDRMTYDNRWVDGTLTDVAYDLDGDSLVFSKLSGPDWLTVLPDGSYFGQTAPSNPLTTEFIVQVSDGNGGTDQGVLRFHVLPDQRIAYEGFEGTVGADINGTTGGTGWASSWSSDLGWDFGSAGLAFPGMDDVTGLKATMGGQGTTLTRTFLAPVTVGSDEGDSPQIWIAGLMDLYATDGIAPGHSVQVKLLHSSAIGYFGKGVNKSIGFDLGGWHEVSGNLGIGNGTAGKWFMVLHLKANGTGTDLDFYAAKEGEAFDISDPSSFPHTASASYAGKVVMDGLGMYRWNNTESFIDEICISPWYEAVYSMIDSDKDGMPDAWEEHYFSEGIAALPGENADGDAQDNLAEYIAGMDPTNAASQFLIGNEVEDGFVLFWEAASNRLYRVNWASSMTNTFQALEDNIELPCSSYTDTIHNAESKGFYKVDVRVK